MRPGKGFRSRPLVLASIAPGTLWWRLFPSQYPDPLGYGYGPSRFSDPKISLAPPRRYGVVYLGSTVKVCFAEAVLRDRGDGRLGAFPIEWAEIEARVCTKLRIERNLNVVDLRRDGPIRMGIPTDVPRAQSQKLARIWSRALWSHDAKPDGIVYESRLTGEVNIAIFDRALTKLKVVERMALVDCRSDLAGIIKDFDLAII